jgi:predicted nucleic acid-binding protein
MVILADSSVWIDHFRKPEELLPQLIGQGMLYIHPFVICELALGSVPDRGRLIAYLQSLPSFEQSEPPDLLEFVHLHELHGKGVGMIDANLLKCCAESDASLWTTDKRLFAQAERLGVAYQP